MLRHPCFNAAVMTIILVYQPLGPLSVRLKKNKDRQRLRIGNATTQVDTANTEAPIAVCTPSAGRVVISALDWLPPFRWMRAGWVHETVQELYSWAIPELASGKVNTTLKPMIAGFSKGMISPQNVAATIQGVSELDWSIRGSTHQVWFDITCLLMRIGLSITNNAVMNALSSTININGGMRAGWISETTYMMGDRVVTGYPVEGKAGEPLIQVVKSFGPGTKVASAILLPAERGLPAATAKGTKGVVQRVQMTTGPDQKLDADDVLIPMVLVKFVDPYGTRELEVWQLRHDPLSIYSSLTLAESQVEQVLPPVWRPHCISHGIPPGKDAVAEISGETLTPEDPGIPYFHVGFTDNSWLGPVNAVRHTGSNVVRNELCLAAISAMRTPGKFMGNPMAWLITEFKPYLEKFKAPGVAAASLLTVHQIKKHYNQECARAGNCVPAHGTGSTCYYCGGYSCDGPTCNTMRRYVPDKEMALALQNSIVEELQIHYAKGVPQSSEASAGKLMAEVAAGRDNVPTGSFLNWITMTAPANTSHTFKPWDAAPFWGDCSSPGWVRIGPSVWLPEWDPNGIRLLRPLTPAKGCNPGRGATSSRYGPTAEVKLTYGIQDVLNAWIGNPYEVWSEAQGVDITSILVGPRGRWKHYWKETGVTWVAHERTKAAWNKTGLGAMPEANSEATPTHLDFAAKELKEQGGELSVTLPTFFFERQFLAERDAYLTFTWDSAAATVTLESYQYDGSTKINQRNSGTIQLPPIYRNWDTKDPRPSAPHLIIEGRPPVGPSGSRLQPTSPAKAGPYDPAKCFCGGTSPNTYGM